MEEPPPQQFKRIANLPVQEALNITYENPQQVYLGVHPSGDDPKLTKYQKVRNLRKVDVLIPDKDSAQKVHDLEETIDVVKDVIASDMSAEQKLSILEYILFDEGMQIEEMKPTAAEALTQLKMDQDALEETGTQKQEVMKQPTNP